MVANLGALDIKTVIDGVHVSGTVSMFAGDIEVRGDKAVVPITVDISAVQAQRILADGCTDLECPCH